MKRTAKLAVFLAAWLATQYIISPRLDAKETPHTHAEAVVSEPQLTTVVRSVSGAEITTIAHFNCLSCGGNLDILFPNCSRLSKREIRNRLRAEEQWCDAGQRCDWHGKLPARSLRKLRLSYGEWVKSVAA